MKLTIYYLTISSVDGISPIPAENPDKQRYLCKGIMSVSQSSLPLKERYVLFYSKSSAKVFKLRPGKRLDENICSLVICRNILELDRTFLHHITFEVILNLYMLRLVMKYKIH